MEIRNARATSRDDLLGCPAAMLGLDLSEIESRGGEMFETVTTLRELRLSRSLRIGPETRS